MKRFAFFLMIILLIGIAMMGGACQSESGRRAENRPFDVSIEIDSSNIIELVVNGTKYYQVGSTTKRMWSGDNGGVQYTLKMRRVTRENI